MEGNVAIGPLAQAMLDKYYPKPTRGLALPPEQPKQMGGAESTQQEQKQEEQKKPPAPEAKEEKNEVEAPGGEFAAGVAEEMPAPPAPPPTEPGPEVEVERPAPTVPAIIRKVCELSEQEQAFLLNCKKRGRVISRPRQVLMYLLALFYGDGGQSAVARVFGCDHTSVRNALIKITHFRRGNAYEDYDLKSLELLTQVAEHFGMVLPDPALPPPTMRADD